MKIFCIGRNYAAHAAELKNEVPTQPVVFMKPPTALLLNDDPFYLPDFSEDVHYEGEIVLKVAKNGKYIQPSFARNYYKEMAYGIDFTARDLQQNLKEKGHPWEVAKGFDNSAAVSKFISLEDVDTHDITLKTYLNDEVVQDGNTSALLFSFDEIICYLSQFFTLQQGDLIFTGTPAGVGSVKVGDTLQGEINGIALLQCEIK